MPLRTYQKSNADHLLEAIRAIQEAEKALGRMRDGDMSTEARGALARIRKSLAAAKTAGADCLEAVTGGALTSSTPKPQFSDQEG